MISTIGSRSSLEECAMTRYRGSLQQTSRDETLLGTIDCVKNDRHLLTPADYAYVFDAHSGDLADFAELFDDKWGEIKPSVANEVGRGCEISQAHILYIHHISLAPECRGRDLSLLLVDRACDTINSHMSLTALSPAPHCRDRADPLCSDHYDADTNQLGRAKLRKHYRKIGLKPLGKTFSGRWNGDSLPDIAEVCPQFFKTTMVLPQKTLNESSLDTHIPKRDYIDYTIGWTMTSVLNSNDGVSEWTGKLSQSYDDPCIGYIKCTKIMTRELSHRHARFRQHAHLAPLLELFDETGDFDVDGKCYENIADLEEGVYGGILMIHEMYVHPEYRGQHLGLFMVDDACQKINNHLSLDFIKFPAHETKDASHLRSYFAKLSFDRVNETCVARWNGSVASNCLRRSAPALFR